MKPILKKLAAAAAFLAFAFNAHAGIGGTSVDDVTLAGQNADAFAYQEGWNPQSGPNGDTSGFGSELGSLGIGSYALLDKYVHNGTFTNAGPLTFTFTETTGTNGVWTVTNTSATSNITLDLIFAIHAGNQATAWLFDNQTIAAGQTLTGDWAIEWVVGNNQNNNPGFSNLTLFSRDVTITPVPEPGTYAMLVAGLGVVALIRRRRKS
jgi:hypothetical protein